jgi:signal transduction histidine kinase
VPAARFVEVYVPFTVAGQGPLVFEAYYDYRRVDNLARQLMMQTIPLVIAPLLLLQLIQIPASLSLARRLRRHEQERTRLLERGLATADQERARFAADLHDGPIQDLAGIGYVLGAVAPAVPERQAPLMSRVQEALTRAIESLRNLMTDLYPPDLDTRTLTQTLSDLAEPLRAAGVEVELEAGDLPPLSTESVAALYRVGKESLVNVQKHAQASRVVLRLDQVRAAEAGGVDRVRLVVQDDGVGVDEGQIDRRAEGHLGLRLLTDRVESLGGQLEIVSRPGQGTRVEAEVPVRPTFAD